MNAVDWKQSLQSKLHVFLTGLIISLGSLTPHLARADATSDALNLAASFAPVVDSYIAPASLKWLPALYSALSIPACKDLGNDIAVANCAGALLDSDVGSSLDGDAASIAKILEIYIDVRSSDWGELFNDIFRLAAAGDPLDVACKILALATGGFPICGALELLYDIGKFAVQAAEAIVDTFSVNDWGESEFKDLPGYFNSHYLPNVERYAQNMRKDWNYWNNGIGEIVNPCVSFLTHHRWAKDNAREKCQNGMWDGRQASTEHRFIDKGFLQLVEIRYGMLELPGVVDQRFAALSTSLNTTAPGLRLRLEGVWGLDGNGKTTLDAQGVGIWPNGSLGAVAAAALRLYIPRFGEGEPVMKQKLQEAVNYALANTPDWKAWQQLSAAVPNIPCKANGDSFFCDGWDNVKTCKAQYGTPLSQLPLPAKKNDGRIRVIAPACAVENTDSANKGALLKIYYSLRNDWQLKDCSYDIIKHPQTIECVGGSPSALKCASLLKERYGEFGLPNAGASCTGMTVQLRDPPANTVIDRNLPRTIPGNIAETAGPPAGSVTPAPVRVTPREATVTQSPGDAPPMCKPTREPGVMQCPIQASLPNCERARRLGQVKQCLPP